MKNHTPTTAWRSFITNFSIAPVELKAFIVFCFIVSVSSLIIQFILPRAIEETLVPITGWNMGFVYIFNMIISIGPMKNPHGKIGMLTSQYGNILILVISTLFGLRDLLTYDGGYTSDPYLSHSPLRPIWTIAIPIGWIIVLLTPRIKKYYQSLFINNVIG